MPRAAGFGAGPPRRRRAVRPPQYSAANSTWLPAGGVKVELDELNVAGSASMSTGTIAKLLLLSAAPLAVPAWEAAQSAAAAGQVISVLPVTQTAPGSFVLKRGTNGCSTTAPAVAGTTAATRRNSATRLTTRPMVGGTYRVPTPEVDAPGTSPLCRAPA